MSYQNTYNIAIQKGKNWFTKAGLRKFRMDRWYDLVRAPMVASDYINKAVGVSRKINPHKDSVRLGWRRDEDLKIHWYVYSYINGTRSWQEIEWFAGEERILVTFQMIPTKDLVIENQMQDANMGLGMVLSVPNDSLKKQYIHIPFKPKWFTNFYWGGEGFPNKADSYWLNTNQETDSAIVSMYNTAFSTWPLPTSILTLLAILLGIVGLNALNTVLAVVCSILGLTTFLLFILRNFVNYERWLLSIQDFYNRMRLRRKTTDS